MENVESAISKRAADKAPGPIVLVQAAEQLADRLWQTTVTWNDFAKMTIGGHLIHAMDEVGVQLRLMLGRTVVSQHLQCIKTARRSLIPVDYYLQCAQRRGLVESADAEQLRNQLIQLAQNFDRHAQSITRLANQKIAEKKKEAAAKAEQVVSNNELKKDATVAH